MTTSVSSPNSFSRSWSRLIDSSSGAGDHELPTELPGFRMVVCRSPRGMVATERWAPEKYVVI